MLLCLADFQGADDAIDVFFWYLRGAGGGKHMSPWNRLPQPGGRCSTLTSAWSNLKVLM